MPLRLSPPAHFGVLAFCVAAVFSSGEALATTTYGWHNDAFADTLVSGNLCSTDGTVINCNVNIVPPAQLGTGTPNSTNFLRGDGIWATPTGAGIVSGTGSAGYGAVWQNGTTLTYDSSFYIDTTGHKVGIGSTVPLNLLDIGTSGGIHIGAGAPTNTSYAVYNNGGTLTWNGTAIALGTTTLAIGTSAISGGTTTRILYDNGGTLGEYTLTGSGTSVVMATSPTIATPTFTTSATGPLLIGGTSTTSTLTLQPTSGAGTTGADIILKVGNNGATEAVRITNAGSIGIGTASPAPSAIVDLWSTTKGVLGPRMTSAQRTAIASPVAGLSVFDTDYAATFTYNGSSWQQVAAGSSSLTVGSTPIASGTTTRILYDNGGVLGEYTVSGTGSVAMTTSPTIATPTFTVSATAPLIIGGTGITSPLTLRSTSGVGTTGADIIFQTGNNGATEAMRILNSGAVGIGTASPAAGLEIKNAGAASTPAERISGAWYTGGSTTTTKPQLLIEPAGTTSTAWNTSGTGIGINSPFGFSGNLLDIQMNGVDVFRVAAGGNVFAAATIGAYNGVNAFAPDATPYASSSSSSSTPGNQQLFAQNSAGGDSTISYLSLVSQNSATTIQSAYIGAFANASGYTPTIVVGQQTGATAYQERMRIDTSGKVGIGSSSPLNPLDIGTAGGIHIAAGVPSNTSYALYNNGGTLTWNGGAIGTSGGSMVYPGAGIGNSTGSAWGTSYSTTGSGSVVALATSPTIATPTFTTSATSPLLIGGTGTTSTLTFKTTTGVGTTNADMIFQVGNNGATEAMRILNSGKVGIGSATPSSLLDVYAGVSSGADVFPVHIVGNVSGNAGVYSAIENLSSTSHAVGVELRNQGSTKWQIGNSSDNNTTDDFFIWGPVNGGNAGNALRIIPSDSIFWSFTGGTLYGSVKKIQVMDDSTNSYGVIAGVDTTNQIGVIASDGNGGSSSLVLATPNSGTYAERMRILPSGYVGIGSSAPINALDIGTTQGIHIASGTPTNTSYALYNNGGTLTWNGGAIGTSGGSMVYPGAGIPNSTGSAWGTSYSTSGSGTVVALATSPTIATPTFTASATAPLIIGGTGITSPLTLRSTSGVGTTGADIIFQTGNNGATEAMRILNSGAVGIGTTASSYPLYLYRNTAATSGTIPLSFNQYYVSPSSASTGTFRAVDGEVFYNGTVASANAGFHGVFGYAGNPTNYNVGYLYGAMALAENGGTATVSKIYGIDAAVNNNSSGTISQATAGYFHMANAGTVTTGYGIYVDTIYGNTNYGIYQATNTNKNYFAGNIGIGSLSPLNALDIAASGGIHMAAGVPTNTSAALYNNGGTLYWSGVAIGSGGGGGSSQWTTSGSNIYYNTGNVGVGTANPDAPLTVAGGGTALKVKFDQGSGALDLDGHSGDWNLIDLTNQGTGIWNFGKASDNSFYIFNYGLGNYPFWIDTSNNITIGGNGNVYLPSTGGARIYDINPGGDGVTFGGDANFNGWVGIGTPAANNVLNIYTSGWSAYVNIARQDETSEAGITIGTAAGLEWVIYSDDGSPGDLKIQNRNQGDDHPGIHMFVNSDNLILAENSGTVMIGNNGESFWQSNASLHLARDNHNYMVMEVPSYATGGLALEPSQDLYMAPQGALHFRTGITWNGDWTATGSEPMTILNGGNVGIGTASPNGTMHVYSASDTNVLLVQGPSGSAWSTLTVDTPSSTSTSDGKAIGITGGSLSSWYKVMIYSDGKYGIGDGTAIRDVYLSRDSANTMKISSDGSTGTANFLVTGKVGIGTASPSATLHVVGTGLYGVAGSSIGKIQLAGNTSGTITIQPQAAAGTYNFNLPTTAGTSGYPLLSGGGGSTAMTWGTIGGNTTKFATVGATWTGTNYYACRDSSGNIVSSSTACSGSSLKFKKEVETAHFGLKEVEAMRPVTFTWKDRNQRDIGFIAEEMEKINPLFATYKDDDGSLFGVKYAQLTAVLVGAIKELKAANDNLVTQLKAVTGTVTAVVTRLDGHDVEIKALKAANDNQAHALEELRKEFRVYKAAHP